MVHGVLFTSRGSKFFFKFCKALSDHVLLSRLVSKKTYRGELGRGRDVEVVRGKRFALWALLSQVVIRARLSFGTSVVHTLV